MTQIALLNRSRYLSNADVAFFAAACNDQVIECAAAWSLRASPVAFYSDAAGLPASDVRIMSIVDVLDEPGALGYHDDRAGVIYGMVLAQDEQTSVTLSHECLEELVDPTCEAWRPMPSGRQVALEVADPVEADSYLVTTTVLGETRGVSLSNYVLPAWFQVGASGPYDRLGKLSAPLTMTSGGYQVVMDERGNITNVFASHGTLGTATRLARKLATPGSRLLRRLCGKKAAA